MANNNSLFDNPKNVKKLLYFLYACCALLFILDFVIHRHVMHIWEKLWGFYPLYGFVSCVVLVLVATRLRKVLMRPEDYYEAEQAVNKEKLIPSDDTKSNNIQRTDSQEREPREKKGQELKKLNQKNLKMPGDQNVDN